MTAPPSLPLTEMLTEEHKEFLHGLFTTALEGGIGYWSQCSEYHWMLNKDAASDTNTLHEPDINYFRAVIHPPYDVMTDEQLGWGIWADKLSGDTPEDLKPLTIDLEVVHRGATLLCLWVQGLVDDKGQPVLDFDKRNPARKDSYLWQYVESYASDGQRGDYDAGVADAVVQFGLFGEVVYG